MAEDASSPWAFMRDWWELLRDYELIMAKPTPRRGSLQASFRSLDVVAPHAFYSHDRRLWPEHRDALELVMLQLTIDPAAFMAMAREFCMVDETTEAVWGDFDPDQVMPRRLQLTLDQQHTTAGSNPTWAKWLLFELLMPVALEHRTARFRQARDETLALAAELSETFNDDNWTIPVDVALHFREETVLVSLLEHFATLRRSMDFVLEPADEPEEEARRAASRGYPFRAACVDVVMSGLELSPTLKAALTDMNTTPGVKLRDVYFHSGKQQYNPYRR